MAHNPLPRSQRKLSLVQKTLSASLLLLAACSTPKPLLPSQIAPTPLSIRTNPEIMIAKTEMRITCQLPTDLEKEGTFVFGVVDMFMEQGPIDKLQYTRLILGQCQPIRIVCGYVEAGAKHATLIYKDMDPNGDCGRASQY